MHKIKLIFWSFLLLAISLNCTSLKMLPREFNQYTFKEGAYVNKEKESIQISLNVLRPTDVLDYPQYFSFQPEDLPKFKGNPFVKILTEYDGKKWVYIFSDPSYEKQLVVCHVVMKNNTDHIVRMKDARVYLIPKEKEPISSLNNFSEVEQIITNLEAGYRGEEGWNKMQVEVWGKKYPFGLAASILNLNKSNIKLITDVGAEVLPTFSYSGLLVFPYLGNQMDDLTISFFDITIKTDAAGNPIEKARFDFPVTAEKVTMEYNASQKKWLKLQ